MVILKEYLERQVKRFIKINSSSLGKTFFHKSSLVKLNITCGTSLVFKSISNL